MCLDHPEKVIKAAIIDIVPTLDMWAAMNKEAAIGGWHWPFMAQPFDFPERMLGSVPADWFMRKKLLKRPPMSAIYRRRSGTSMSAASTKRRSAARVATIAQRRPSTATSTPRTSTVNLTCRS